MERGDSTQGSMDVLVVDQDAAFRQTLGATLRAAGMRVDARSDGGALTPAYDVALVDLSHSASGGRRALRTLVAGHRTVCITVVESGNRSGASEGYQLGAHGLLWKPLDLAALPQYLRSLKESQARILRPADPAAPAGWMKRRWASISAGWRRVSAARRSDLKVIPAVFLMIALAVPLIRGTQAVTNDLSRSGERTLALLDRAATVAERTKSEGERDRVNALIDKAQVYLESGKSAATAGEAPDREAQLEQLLDRAEKYFDKTEGRVAPGSTLPDTGVAGR